jgi:hypothetical protein
MSVNAAASIAQPIGTFLWEAFDNARRHGADGLDRTSGRPIPVMRFLHGRRTTEFANQRVATTTTTVPGLSDYLDHLSRHPIWRGLGSARSRGGARLVELTVADSGPGIAASMHGSVAIYHDSLERERKLFKKAMTMAGTRYGEGSGQGLGFPMMLRATRAGNGVLLIRSGRLMAYRHYLGDEPHHDSIVTIASDQLAHVWGTTVSLVVIVPLKPTVAPEQMTLEELSATGA